MIEPLRLKIKTNCNQGLFHDSRGDIDILAKVFVILQDKINEVINTINESEKQRKSQDKYDNIQVIAEGLTKEKMDNMSSEELEFVEKILKYMSDEADKKLGRKG